MRNKTLIVVDMQNDFIDGALGTKEAQEIVKNVREKIMQYRNRGERVIFTRDTHGKDYLSTSEGRKLPVEHCIKGTKGWEIEKSLLLPGTVAAGTLPPEVSIIDKPTFGYTGWGEIITDETTEIELAGLCTDICVVSNALILKAQFPNVEITVDASCCAGVTPESHRAALMTMKSCQIHVMND